MTILSKQQVSRALHIAEDSCPWDLTEICTDSRIWKPGDCFVAIPGETFDGHQFIPELLDKGANFVIAQEDRKSDYPELSSDRRILWVPQSIEAIRSLAKAYRQNLKTKIFAVGGSNGKTTTKELLHFLLESLHGTGHVFKTKKSENSILGIALSLLKIRREEIAVIEIGIDEPGWMDKHLEIVQPHYGVITSLSEEHLEKLKNLETVIEEELKLLHYLRESSGGFAANWDLEAIRLAKLPEQSLRYALHERADVEGAFKPINGLHAFGVHFQTPLIGKHNAQNLLAALTALRLLMPQLHREDLIHLQRALPSFKGEPHRSVWMEFPNHIRVFDDCYNANPASMETAIQSFVEACLGNPMIAVLGDMRELGDSSLKAHQRMINLASVIGFQYVLLFGPQFKAAAESLLIIPENVEVFEQASDLEFTLKNILSPGQCVLLKGSRGMKMERFLSVFK